MSETLCIAVGGFQHETNTFAPHRATYKDFVQTDGWPGLTRGDDLFARMDGLNIPISGFIDAARQNQHQLYPLLWCSAEPSGYVTEEAFESVAALFCESLANAGHLDAVYLDLHGAMVCEHYEDGEGELLRRVREIVGLDLPLVVSLDLHANITQSMVELATGITIYRTYPHLDMAETGARAYALTEKLLRGQKLVGGMRKLPFLIPLTSQCTDFDPCRSIYEDVGSVGLEATDVFSADFAAGFPPADITECGAAVVVYGGDQSAVDRELDRLLKRITDAEALFVNHLASPDEAVRRAMAVETGRPVVLADAQDNPGAGGTSDTTGLLEALVRNHARAAGLAVLYDPDVATLAHQAGFGKQIEVDLGAKSGFPGVLPFSAQFTVEALGDGRFTFTGEMNKNVAAELGPMALLRVVDADSDVCVIVGSQRAQCLDLAMMRHLGVEPAQQRILAVKSSVHFRADFDPIAAQTIVVFAPGAHPCKLVDLPYKNLRSGIRLEPLGPEHVCLDRA